MTASDETLAYFAGFFDGEGCVNFSRTRTSAFIRVLIVNTNKDILEEIRSHFGGDIKPLCSRKPGWKQGWMLRISWAKAVDFLTQIYPWLRIKKEQAEVAFAWDANRPGKGRLTATERDGVNSGLVLLRAQLRWLNTRVDEKGEADPVSACLDTISGYNAEDFALAFAQRHPEFAA